MIDIWTHPRETIREILSNRPGHLFYYLASAYGITHSIHLVMRYGVSPSLHASKNLIMLVNILFGIPFGILTVIVFSFVLKIVIRAFGGKNEFDHIKIALSWSAVPYVPMLIIILLLGFLGPEEQIIRSGTSYAVAVSHSTSVFSTLSTVYMLLIRSVLSIWSIVLLIVCLSEISNLSVMKSVVSIIISVIVIIVPFFVVLGAISRVVSGG